MSEPRTEAAFIQDILDFSREALDFVAGMTFEEFKADKKTVYAVIRAMEVIGEATKRISSSFKAQHPDVPWKSMAGMRDRLIHDYIGVDLEVLWKTVNERLPPLEHQMLHLLSQLKD